MQSLPLLPMNGAPTLRPLMGTLGEKPCSKVKNAQGLRCFMAMQVVQAVTRARS